MPLATVVTGRQRAAYTLYTKSLKRVTVVEKKQASKKHTEAR
jgi:hypothetical protein